MHIVKSVSKIIKIKKREYFVNEFQSIVEKIDNVIYISKNKKSAIFSTEVLCCLFYE